MGWTKRQFVEQAFDEIGLAAHSYDLTADQLQSGLRKLDAFMASLNAKGVRLGYPLPGSPGDSSLDEQTSVPDSSNECVYTNLAIRIAPSFGKTVSIDTKSSARMTLNTLLARAAMPGEMQLNGTVPAGAGNKQEDNPFLDDPTESILAGADSAIDFD